MNMKKFYSVFAAAALIFFSGCGYKFGSLMHPQITSVAVAPVTNESLFYNASAVLRQKLTEVFTTDGSLKLKSIGSADCIVYARILKITFKETSGHIRDDDDFLPNEWTVSAEIEYSVILPGRAKPLLGPRTVTGHAEFVSDADLENARTNGMRQAMFDAAKTIVMNLTEAW